jgi:hypothetical protein
MKARRWKRVVRAAEEALRRALGPGWEVRGQALPGRSVSVGELLL